MLASGLLLVAVLTCLSVMVLKSVWQQKKPKGLSHMCCHVVSWTTPPYIRNYLQLRKSIYTTPS
jgi:cytochrome P450 family 2 subfamily A polypeptide 6/cytochrome P450 family 2 subfamily A polypeptide 7/cytochrome P450 family 2 subfamily A polypeptide 13